LFKSLYVKALLPNAPALLKGLIRAVKGLGLMYIVEINGGQLEFRFDGPVSALRQTERYGTRLAKLVPYITSAEKWEIEAQVKLGERIYVFKESGRTAPPLPKTPPHAEQFDSLVEQEFYKQVSKICHVEREPEALVVDLKRKYEKITKVGKPLLVLVSEELAMATWKQLMPNVVVFKDRPRLSDVFKYIKPYCVNHR